MSSIESAPQTLTRRRFVTHVAAATGTALASPVNNAAVGESKPPAFIVSDASRPIVSQGVASGDVTDHSAVVWSCCDRPARMRVDYSTTESFNRYHRVDGPHALAASGFTAKAVLVDLPSGERIFYRVTFRDLSEPGKQSAPVVGSFSTAPRDRRNVHFAWSGDTAGQGFGINPEFGGMKIFEAIRRIEPHFFIHSGDYIYADQPIPPTIQLDNGDVWKNVTTAATSKVAETLAEFRGNYAYNLLDENVQRFNAEIPQLVQWDDHETTNNWYPGEMLIEDDRYTVKSASLLAARARRAFLEYTPIQNSGQTPERIYRAFQYGPLLDVLMLDMRTNRGPNSTNRQTDRSRATALLGRTQLDWLKRNLLLSKATWKVIASDMPIGLIVRDGPRDFENMANGDGEPLGRELEMAELLRFIKANRIRNIVWLTADVHYAAAHYYDPAKARFTDFTPFWEFVAGPLNAGTFGPNELDNTFGPQVVFQGIPQNLKPRRPPSDGYQFFGTVRIDGQSEVMAVGLYDLDGAKLYEVDLPAAR